MAKLIRSADFGVFLVKLQGSRSITEFERETGVARQILHRLRVGKALPSPEVQDKLGIETFYREKEASVVPTPGTAAKKVTKKK